MSVPIYFLDVFAERALQGNQLAVVFDAERLNAAQMQAIAKETNFSETTFLHSRAPSDGGYDVRIFTPDTELPFAGHPTLGTAYVIRKILLKDAVGEVTLNLAAGRIPVSFEPDEDGRAWMRQPPVKFLGNANRSAVAAALSLEPDDLAADFAPQLVSTGVPTIVAPLASGEALQRAEVEPRAYRGLLEVTGAALLQVFCRDGYESGQVLSIRVFGHCFGVPEDPATGSAAGCLAAYLAQEQYLGGSRVDCAAGQGYALGRPSTLYLRADVVEQSVEVEVGGRIQLVGCGEFYV